MGKITDMALGVENVFSLAWVHNRLSASKECPEDIQSCPSTPVVPGQVAIMEKRWQEYFSNPSLWWDNRFIKVSPKFPDFKHKRTSEGLWLDSWWNPHWVEAKVATLRSEQLHIGDGSTERYSFNPCSVVAARLGSLFCIGFFHASLWSPYQSCRAVDFSTPDDFSKLCEDGRLEEAIHIIKCMIQENVQPPRDAYVSLMKGCAKREALVEAKQVHALMIESGRDSGIFIENLLIDMYGKCGGVSGAQELFNKMSERNLFSWTALVSAYADNGHGVEAINLFQQMQCADIAPDKVAFGIVLKACARAAALEEGKHFHSEIVKSGFESDVNIGIALIDMYARCGCIEDARSVFDNMRERSIVSWNVIITGYAQQGYGHEALALYEKMKQESLQPDNVTFVVLLSACATIGALEKGKELHYYLMKSGYESDVVVGNTLIDMYAKCGSIVHACKVFNNMRERNLVSWNALIAGYGQQGLGKEALALYELMKQEKLQPDNVTYLVLINACASIAALEQGKQLHSDIVRRGIELDVVLNSALVDMYAKCGDMENACKVFNNMQERNVVSWNAMVAGYTQQDLGREALALFDQMKWGDVQPDYVTYILLLNACASIGSLEQGKQLHSHIIKGGFDSDISVCNTLIDMYAKCGNIDSACKVFDSMHTRDSVSWNVMIAAYARQGLGKEAVELLDQMLKEGMKPGESTYVSALFACSHSGLVHEGRRIFDSMREHDVTPKLEHYSCMVDLLCRASCLEEAEDLINKMPIQPDFVIWLNLLGAARNSGHVDLGRRAFDHVIELDPGNSAAYVQLSNIYATAGRTDELSKINQKIKDMKEQFV